MRNLPDIELDFGVLRETAVKFDDGQIICLRQIRCTTILRGTPALLGFYFLVCFHLISVMRGNVYDYGFLFSYLKHYVSLGYAITKNA